MGRKCWIKLAPLVLCPLSFRIKIDGHHSVKVFSLRGCTVLRAVWSLFLACLLSGLLHCVRFGLLVRPGLTLVRFSAFLMVQGVRIMLLILDGL